LLYVDSNVFLYASLYGSEVEEALRSREFLLRVAKGEVRASTSVLTWDEVVWVVRKVEGGGASSKIGSLLLRFPNLRILAVKRSTIEMAQELMEKYGLRPRDSIHAASALENGISRVISFDRHFDLVEGLTREEP